MYVRHNRLIYNIFYIYKKITLCNIIILLTAQRLIGNSNFPLLVTLFRILFQLIIRSAVL